MKKIDIAPPKSMEITFDEGKSKVDLLNTSTPIIKISFRMVIDDIIDSNIMQLVPLEFGKSMVKNLMGSSDISEEIKTPEPTYTPPTEDAYHHIEQTRVEPQSQRVSQSQVTDVARNDNINYNNISKKEEKIIVPKPEFQSFETSIHSPFNESIDLVGDIPVEIVVELGRTNRKISEILEFGQGTVIELDKLVGEALNIYANGKYIAKGEVIVIDDNFGVRVTEIENTYKRII